MRKILTILCLCVVASCYADIIVTKSNGNIEDVTVVEMRSDVITYTQGGKQKTIASDNVDGVLYDDGRYVAPPRKPVEPSAENTAWDDGSLSDNSQSKVLSNSDSWDDGSTKRTKSAVNKQQREREARGSNSEVGQAFKEAGQAIKGAFSTMFQAMKKDKSSSNESTDTSTDNTSPNNSQSTSSDDSNW